MPASTHSVASLLEHIDRVGLRVTGARSPGHGRIELEVCAGHGQGSVDRMVAQGWPQRQSHVVLHHHADGSHASMEVVEGIWLTWRQAGPERMDPAADRRLLAFEVGQGEDGVEEEVVMASTADEAATYYARGWGLPEGSLVSVVWRDLREPGHARASARHDLLFRVVDAGRVVRLAG